MWIASRFQSPKQVTAEQAMFFVVILFHCVKILIVFYRIPCTAEINEHCKGLDTLSTLRSVCLVHSVHLSVCEIHFELSRPDYDIEEFRKTVKSFKFFIRSDTFNDLLMWIRICRLIIIWVKIFRNKFTGKIETNFLSCTFSSQVLLVSRWISDILPLPHYMFRRNIAIFRCVCVDYCTAILT
jgi:hypothetical protein